MGYLMKNKEYEAKLRFLKGRTIAVVYIFEKENALGFKHYWVWKSNIITGWLNAIQELDCLPLILDVRTFIQKAIYQTLPQIDFVINLNCGCYELSTLSLVPSMCSFLSIPCIPCDASAILASENKLISNLLAQAKDLNVPKTLNESNAKGIYRPLNLGSSIGVRKGECENIEDGGIYQEFIPGYDATIPIVYNPLIQDIDILPPLLYLPTTKDPNWIYGEKEKIDNEGLVMLPLSNVDKNTKEKIIDFARIFPIQTFGRIDTRLKFNGEILTDDIESESLLLDDLYFIEINSMPTIENWDSFELSFTSVEKFKNYSISDCVTMFKNIVKKPTIHNFLLSCSMIALSKAKY
jgi:hypothetical protein